jgi:hypothetical protein
VLWIRNHFCRIRILIHTFFVFWFGYLYVREKFFLFDQRFFTIFFILQVPGSESLSESELFSDSGSDPAKTYGFFRIRIQNTALNLSNKSICIKNFFSYSCLLRLTRDKWPVRTHWHQFQTKSRFPAILYCRHMVKASHPFSITIRYP